MFVAGQFLDCIVKRVMEKIPFQLMMVTQLHMHILEFINKML